MHALIDGAKNPEISALTHLQMKSGLFALCHLHIQSGVYALPEVHTA